MRKLLLFAMIFTLLSCEETDVSEFLDKPVVESYLYAEGSPTVKISKLIPFKSDMILSDTDLDQLKIGITDLTTGQKYSLQAKGGGTYQNADLIVQAGNTYQLSFPYNGMEISATTLVPEKPVNFTLSATSISIAERGVAPGGSASPEMPSPVVLNWENKDQSYYLVYVKNVESVKEAINSKENKSDDFFRNQPTNSDHYQLNPQSFKFYGMHRVILYKIQPEYVIFFQNNSTSSISITEIKANVENGFGIFTAVNSLSVYLYVGKP